MAPPGLWRPSRVSSRPRLAAVALTWLPEVGLAQGRHVSAGEGLCRGVRAAVAGVSARRMGGARVGRLGPSCPRPGSLPVSEEERKRRGLEESRPFVARGLDAVNPPVS